MAKEQSAYVTIEGHELRLSNLNKVLYPSSGFTKADVLHYYEKISSIMLPHLKGRALTMKRFPEGVEKDFFYEKRCPVYRPDWLKTAYMTSESKKKKGIPFCQIDSLAGMVWVVNLASLEFHTLLSRAPDFERPTMVVFDLDPGEPAGFRECCQIALLLKTALDSLKLKSFPKVSGGKGLHVHIPLNTSAGFDEAKAFALGIASYLEKQNDDRVTSNMSKSVRKNKVFIDWSQNDRHKTTVCVYSLRAKARPTAALPLDWKEVEKAADSKINPDAFVFEAAEALQRVNKKGDLFKTALTLKQKLPSFDTALSKAA